MHRLFSSASGTALLAASALLFAPLPALADSFTVPTGTTTTSQQTVTGSDTGLIEAGGTLDVNSSAIIWDGAASAPGIVITNDGAIISGSRAIDTDGALSGSFTLLNNGSITSENDNFRLDDEFDGGNLLVVNTGSILSEEGQVFDFNGANSANATVVIQNTGTITAEENDAIRLGGGTIEIINSGTIETLSGEDRALKFDDEANIETLQSFTLVNEAGGRIIGGDDGFKFAADSDTSSAVISITNYGLIDGGVGQALDFADLTSPDNQITITNYGTMQSSEADGMRPGAGATVINYGLIQSTDLTSDGDGIDFQDFGGTVINKTGGEILAAKHGITGDGAVDVTNEAGASIVGQNGSGINIDSSGDVVVTVTNYGTISGQVTGLLDDDGAADGVPDGDGDGVDVDGQLILNNYGLIQGTGATGTKDGDLNTADGIAAGGGLIYNHAGGVIQAYDNYDNVGVDDVGRAILIDDSSQGPAPFATTLINEGTITSDGVAVTFIGANNDTIQNSGLIESGNAKAVDMGDGDDLYIYLPTGQVVGYVTGGDGTDTFELSGTGSFDLGQLGNAATYRDFETLLVGEGSDYTATGTSSFAGEIVVDGQFVLNGSLASAGIAIEDGATLSGNSTFGTLTVGNGGTVAPGNSIGTITVTGTVSFAAGSTYEVEIDQNSSDQIIAGTSDINGGTVVVSVLGPVTAGTVYTIIDAETTTSPTGQFDTLVAPDFLFIDPTLGRDGADVTLTLARNNVTFASLATTANQTAVANAIDAAGGGTLYDDLVAATPGEQASIAAGYDLLSGEVHASLGNTLFNQTTLVADTLISRLRQVSAGGSPEMAALASGGPVTAYAAKAKQPASPIVVKAPPLEPVGPVYTAWAQGFGQWNKADGNGNAGQVDGSLGGFLAGGDVTSNNVTFGLAAGYASASSDVDARLSSADASTVMIAAYTGASFDAFRLRGGASYGWSDIDTQRTASIAGITENPLGSYDGSTVNIFAEAAYAVEAAGVAFEPFAQMAWSWIDTDSFTETGAPTTGLSSSGLSFDVPYSTLGLRLAKSFELGAGTLTPHASFAWRHAYGDVTPELAMAFTDTGSGFGVAGTPIAEDSFVFGAGVDFSAGRNLSLNVGYEGQFASETETNAVKGGFTYRF
ncbi:MAG TPA: autotransporter domain-containing protein [Ancylobacter sp.]